MERYGNEMDCVRIPSDELAFKLAKLYAEVKPQTKENWRENSENANYTKTTMKSLMGAINRHFSDFKRAFSQR